MRQIPHTEEFQVIYADFPTLREGQHGSLLLGYGLCLVTSFQSVFHRKGKQKNCVTVEKPDNHYLSQVIKANGNSVKSCW